MRRFALIGLTTLLLSACGKPAASPAVTTDASGAVHVQTSEGTFESGTGKLPADWPNDVPTYAGATVKYTASGNPATGDVGSMVLLETNDAKDLVTKFYTDELQKSGWTIASTMQAGNSVTILAATKDERSLSAEISNANSVTSIALVVGKK